MLRTSIVAALTCATLGYVMPARPAAAQASGLLMPHRAVYDLELKDASERSGISGMYGRMVYEFNGSACEGYTVSFRFVTKVDTGEDSRMTDLQTTTFEDLKNGNFRFLSRSFTDEQLDKEVRGLAHDDKDGVRVELSAPDKKEVDLAESRFPTEHMLDVLDHARRGDTFFESRIFDGSDSGDRTLLTTTMVGKRTKPVAGEPDAAKAGQFAEAEYWPVTIAYYNDDKAGDGLPLYRMSFKLYDNGIIRDLTMDYGDFVLSGKLADLEVFKLAECK
ncbi:cell envelope integrity EipB family protein [Rhizobium sp. SG2393]|uniref:cell envelope integrity EipB family protein n=1 Tax=Rhizobium sp. SG2393 TaxID=3276279 RepID=UPI003673125B